jgi:hypothetical protein
MRILFLAVPVTALAVLSGCGNLTFHRVETVGIVSGTAGRPIQDQPYTLCVSGRFDDGEVVEGTCDEGSTGSEGRVSALFSTTDARGIPEVTAQLTVAGIDLPAQTLPTTTVPDPDIQDGALVDAQTSWTLDRSLLPVRTTRFELTGNINAAPDATGSITVEVSLEPGGPAFFSGTGPVQTDIDGFYQAVVELSSDEVIPLSDDQIRMFATFDGQTLPGFFDIAGVEGDAPREVIVFASF